MASPTLLEKFMRGAGLTELTGSEILLGHGPKVRSRLKNGSLRVLVSGCCSFLGVRFCLEFIQDFFY